MRAEWMYFQREGAAVETSEHLSGVIGGQLGWGVLCLRVCYISSGDFASLPFTSTSLNSRLLFVLCFFFIQGRGQSSSTSVPLARHWDMCCESGCAAVAASLT